jgi:acetyltransferase-like isoleucine patch superfamily enzyme
LKVYETAKISDRTKIKLGKDSFIGDFVLVTVPLLKMGERSQINAFTRIVGRKPVYVGNDVVVSYGATIITSSDTPKGKYMNDARKEEERMIREGEVHIKDGAFLGANCIIMPGVTVHEKAVVGAGLYIDRDVPANTIVLTHKPYYTKKRKIV